MMHEVLNHNNDIQVMDLYEYFERNGLFFDAPYYKGVDYRDIFIYRKMYEREKPDNHEKQLYLQRLIAAYIDIRDFYYAEHYIREYIELKYDGYEDYRQFLQELENLFKEIKEAISSKNDILINWVDALQTDEIDTMPFLSQMKQQSVYLENAYTQMPWTTMTINVVLTGKNVIDDNLYRIKKYDVNNCRLLKNLADSKCCFRYIGLERIGAKFDKEYICWEEYGRKPMAAKNLWSALSIMANTTQRCCTLLHHIQETHQPYLNGYAKKYMEWSYASVGNLTEYDTDHYQNYEDGKNYMDIQLQWYDRFIADNMTVIYLSDHGKSGRLGYSENPMHVMFMIKNKSNMVPRIERKLYSHVDFCEVIENILKESWDVLWGDRQFVKFQYLDAYSKQAVNEILARYKDKKINNLHHSATLQMRGIKNEKELFIVDVLGNERYYINNDYESNLVNEECYQDRIKYLRELNGRNFINVFCEPEFKESRRLYEAMGIYDFSRLEDGNLK